MASLSASASLAVRLQALALLAPLGAAQSEKTEPFFFTAFGREFVGRASAILEAEVLSAERIGVTTSTFVELRPTRWLHGPGKVDPEQRDRPFGVIGKLATSPTRGSHQLLILRRDPATSQLEILAANPCEGELGRRRREVIEAYLSIALLEPTRRFAAFREFQERELRTRGWPRFHALRELAEVAVATPSRIAAEDLARWRGACTGDAEAEKILDRIEREWRKARDTRR
jgi:hypothetical protein